MGKEFGEGSLRNLVSVLGCKIALDIVGALTYSTVLGGASHVYNKMVHVGAEI